MGNKFFKPYKEVEVRIGQIRKISVLQVTSLKILGRVGTHFFLIFIFWKQT